MKRFASALALAGFVATGTAVAKPADVYLLGHYTHSNFNGLNALYEEEHYGGTQSLKYQHNRFGFGAGYIQDDTWAFEIDYKDLGRFKTDYAYADNFFSEYGSMKVSSQTVVLRSIAMLPITQEFKLEGSIGLALTHSKLKAHGQDSLGDYIDYNERSTSLAPTLGLGASYAFTDNLSLFGRYEYIHNAISSKLMSDNDGDFDNIHASTFDLGVRYTF